LVPRRSGRADVRTFARQMLADHSKVTRGVYDVLRQLDIGAEDCDASRQMRDESSHQREPMYFASSAPFDSTYVEAEARVQREFLAAIDDIMIPRVHSAEMRALLVNLRPAVEARLANAEQLRRVVNKQRVVSRR